ncbi:unnamed protein product [Ilex paraguariensis]|uniref:Secreted protein n=1 Tax=Ilex paraguariensis TaxID=185542 RepID=A0ABC8TFU0_9AQUA
MRRGFCLTGLCAGSTCSLCVIISGSTPVIFIAFQANTSAFSLRNSIISSCSAAGIAILTKKYLSSSPSTKGTFWRSSTDRSVGSIWGSSIPGRPDCDCYFSMISSGARPFSWVNAPALTAK